MDYYGTRTNYQARIADQRDAYSLALDVLSAEVSRAALRRAIDLLEKSDWWRSDNEKMADAAAEQLRVLLQSR